MEYMLHPGGIEKGIIRLLDKASIPPDERNSDWQEFQRWLAVEGNEPLEFDLETLVGQ